MGALFGIEGKRVVVTGGSRGIGLMLAEGFLEAGAEVMVCSRKADLVASATERLSLLGKASGVVADIGTEEGVRAVAQAVADRFGSLDVLVNNAGVTWGAPLEGYPRAGWDKVLGTNVRGVFDLTQALVGPLLAGATPADPARVINIGSVDGMRVPAMENYAYSASKAAVHMLTRHLAKRLADQQITVNAIAPGPFLSDMTAFFLNDLAGASAVGRSIPLGRIGTKDDIVGTSIFLASRAGAYLTGTVIPVDGGITGCNPGSV